MKKIIVSAAALAFVLGGLQPTFAANSQSRDTVTTQGESGKPVPEGATGNNGTKVDSSNKGNPDNTNCNACGSTGPGNSNN